MLSLKDDRDLPTYDGNILYFTAEDLSMDLKVIQMNLQELAQKKQDDLRSWCTYVPHINIYPVAAGHLTMLDEQFCDDYIAKIDNVYYISSVHDVDAPDCISSGKAKSTPSL